MFQHSPACPSSCPESGYDGWSYSSNLHSRGNKHEWKRIQLSVTLLCSWMADWGFLNGSDSKESTCDAGDLGSIPELGRPLRGGHGNPVQYSCLENTHRQGSLVGYSPWGHKESDTTERLSIYGLLCKAYLKTTGYVTKCNPHLFKWMFF